MTYPMEINGWLYSLDADSMTYWKQTDGKFEAICMIWLDTVEGDEGYRPDGDVWVGISADDKDFLDDALEMLNIMPFNITEVGRRVEVEKWMIEYMETH